MSQDVSAGSYSLSETLLNPSVNSGGNYALVGWSCDGGSQNGSSITLDNGEDVSCTATNRFVPMVAVPVNNPLALLLMVLLTLGLAWRFAPVAARRR